MKTSLGHSCSLEAPAVSVSPRVKARDHLWASKPLIFRLLTPTPLPSRPVFQPCWLPGWASDMTANLLPGSLSLLFHLCAAASRHLLIFPYFFQIFVQISPALTSSHPQHSLLLFRPLFCPVAPTLWHKVCFKYLFLFIDQILLFLNHESRNFGPCSAPKTASDI